MTGQASSPSPKTSPVTTPPMSNIQRHSSPTTKQPHHQSQHPQSNNVKNSRSHPNSHFNSNSNSNSNSSSNSNQTETFSRKHKTGSQAEMQLERKREHDRERKREREREKHRDNDKTTDKDLEIDVDVRSDSLSQTQSLLKSQPLQNNNSNNKNIKSTNETITISARQKQNPVAPTTPTTPPSTATTATTTTTTTTTIKHLIPKEPIRLHQHQLSATVTPLQTKPSQPSTAKLHPHSQTTPLTHLHSKPQPQPVQLKPQVHTIPQNLPALQTLAPQQHYSSPKRQSNIVPSVQSRMPKSSTPNLHSHRPMTQLTPTSHQHEKHHHPPIQPQISRHSQTYQQPIANITANPTGHIKNNAMSSPTRHTASHSDPVLPRNSRVRIVGNNRTKWDLLGRIGVVRSAQTLGGWHEVELTDGGIVRVQRNALAVLELPAGDSASAVRIECGYNNNNTNTNSNNNSNNFHNNSNFTNNTNGHDMITQNNIENINNSNHNDHYSSKTNSINGMMGQQQSSSPSHIMQPYNPTNSNTGMISARSGLNNYNSHPGYISNGINNHVARKRPRTKPVGGIVKMRDGVGVGMKTLHANISKLNLNSLRRYRSAYNLNVSQDCSKDELVGAVSNHFQRVTVNESEVISSFLRYLARHGGPAASD